MRRKQCVYLFLDLVLFGGIFVPVCKVLKGLPGSLFFVMVITESFVVFLGSPNKITVTSYEQLHPWWSATVTHWAQLFCWGGQAV